MKLCECGCGEQVADGVRYRHAHHWRAKRLAAGVPDEKVCERCGRSYRRADLPSRQSNRHWLRRKFCSAECQEADLAERAREMRGEKSPVWKGDKATAQAGRKRAREMYPDVQPCEVCGVEKTDRHHRDGNTLNNEPSNIAWLCRKHHIGVEDRMAYRRVRADAVRLERKRALARARRRRYNERKRREARKTA